MKSPELQDSIVAHLRASGRPQSSRDLACRFLRIDRGDEEICRRLLAPLLAPVPGVTYSTPHGWSITRRAGAGGETARRDQGRARHEGTRTERRAATRDEAVPDPSGSLQDFVALASDGAGPGGSGAVRVLSLLPVLGGELCQEEHLPSWAADPEGATRAGDLEEQAIQEGARSGPGAPRPGLDEVDLETLIETIGDLPVVCHRVGREFEPVRRACAVAGVPLHASVISAAKLGHILLGLKTNHAAIDLTTALGLEVRGPDDCRGRVRAVATSFLSLLPLLKERGIESLALLLEFQEMPPAPLDLSPYGFGADDLRALPAAPGVYRFLDRQGAIVYVGKAKNLRVRVSSYFTPSAPRTPKGLAILEAVYSFAIERVASELEAALMEAALIAEHRPRLNRQFEVHERPTPYGPRLNLAVVLRDADSTASRPVSCTVHLLRGGRYVGRVTDIGRPGGAWARAERFIARAYFGKAPGAHTAGDDPRDHDIDWQLVGSYLRRHRDEVSVLDIDECASSGEAAERLRVLVEAVGAGPGRVVAR